MRGFGNTSCVTGLYGRRWPMGPAHSSQGVRGWPCQYHCRADFQAPLQRICSTRVGLFFKYNKEHLKRLRKKAACPNAVHRSQQGWRMCLDESQALNRVQTLIWQEEAPVLCTYQLDSSWTAAAPGLQREADTSVLSAAQSSSNDFSLPTGLALAPRVLSVLEAAPPPPAPVSGVSCMVGLLLNT